jgi:hypothetical protein
MLAGSITGVLSAAYTPSYNPTSKVTAADATLLTPARVSLRQILSTSAFVITAAVKAVVMQITLQPSAASAAAANFFCHQPACQQHQ